MKNMSALTGKLWYTRRKAITPTFHFKILSEFVPIFNKCARTLLDCVKNKVDKGPFYLTSYLSNCALVAVAGKLNIYICKYIFVEMYDDNYLSGAETAMGTCIEAQTNPFNYYARSIMRYFISVKFY